MNILVLCGDFWHPADTVKKGLKLIEGRGISLKFIEDAQELSVTELKKYPVVILSKSNNVSSFDTTPWMTDNVQNVILDYVKNGGGLLAIHSGTAEYSQAEKLKSLLGGVFTHHPEQCEVVVEAFVNHPLTKEKAKFTIDDEHYFMEMTDEKAEIFLRTVSRNGIQPGGWTRLEGKGRVCVLTPGHNVEVWLKPEYQAIIENAINWCSGKLD